MTNTATAPQTPEERLQAVAHEYNVLLLKVRNLSQELADTQGEFAEYKARAELSVRQLQEALTAATGTDAATEEEVLVPDEVFESPVPA